MVTDLPTHPPATRPVAVLVGPPGAGKSTVAALLSERLGVPCHDTDAAIEAAQGRSISDIFIDDDEATFRALERAEVARALASERGIVALGGGAVMDPGTRSALEGQVVVFLDVAIADASRRVGFDKSRPLMAVNPRSSWVSLMKVRRPIYEQVSTVRVDTAGRPAAEVADEIADLLQGLGGTRA
ncbi:MAG: shikimate kinase [Dermatophilaceae bacterium]